MTQKMNLQKGLVGHWTMDSQDISNRTVYDRSGHNNHGELNGGTINESSIIGESVFFNDSNNEYMETISNIDIGTSNWTVSAWVKPESFKEYLHILAQENQGNFTTKVATSGIDSAGVPYFYSTDDRTGAGGASDSLNKNEWGHVVYRYNGDEIAIYKNSEKIVSNTGNTLSVAEGKYRIQGGNNEYQSANHSDTRLYLRALSDNEINQLYQIREQRSYNV